MEQKSRFFIYERKEVLLLVGLAALVALFVFTFGIHLGKRVPPKVVRTGESDVPVVNQIPDQKTTRHDIQEQVLHAQGAADVIADETLRDEVAKAGIRLDPFKQVELPKKSVAEKKGATGEEATHISGLLAKALKAEVPHGTHTLQIAAFSVTEGAKIEEALKKWEHAGVAPWIREVALPQKGRWFRVYLGGYEGREAADHAGAEYKGQGKITSYVVGKIPGK